MIVPRKSLITFFISLFGSLLMNLCFVDMAVGQKVSTETSGFAGSR